MITGVFRKCQKWPHPTFDPADRRFTMPSLKAERSAAFKETKWILGRPLCRLLLPQEL
jgi:hypothetical protein